MGLKIGVLAAEHIAAGAVENNAIVGAIRRFPEKSDKDYLNDPVFKDRFIIPTKIGGDPGYSTNFFSSTGSIPCFLSRTILADRCALLRSIIPSVLLIQLILGAVWISGAGVGLCISGKDG